eukprot:c14973_g1_i1 orf=69-584(+)
MLSLFTFASRCTTGRHTSEKPQITSASSTRRPVMAPVGNIVSTTVSREACSRCRQGFFCSDHGAQPAVITSVRIQSSVANVEPVVKNSEEPQVTTNCEKPRVLDFSAEQTCKNCSKTFTEMENHDTACEYHPGPPVFHDRYRGWKCCNVHVKEFDEFLTIPPCAKGWHRGN